MGIAYFFDTYAFVEIVKKNENYLPYSKNVGIITTQLNLMELHYILLRNCGKEKANFYYNYFIQFAVEISDEAIKEANEFKLRHKKRRLSYVDCIGYIIARMNGIKFLTGDKEFENFDAVEFIK